MTIGVGLIVFSGYLLRYRPENAQYNLGALYGLVSVGTRLAPIAGSLLIAIFATRLRRLGIVSCAIILVCVAAMTVAGKIWGGSMGSSGWIVGFVSIVYIIPAALLACCVTGVASLMKILEVSAVARAPVVICAMLMAIGFTMFVSFVNSPPNIERMIQSLNTTNTTRRLETIQAFGDLQDARLVEPLIDILQNTQEELYIRSSAAWALGKQAGDLRIIQPLIEALQVDNISIREGAIFSLGQVARITGAESDSRAFDALVHALDHPEELLRVAAVQSIGWVADDRVVALLLHALNDESLLVRHHAREHLIRITGVDFGENIEQWQAWYEKNMLP